jgi:hypothetical protein
LNLLRVGKKLVLNIYYYLKIMNKSTIIDGVMVSSLVVGVLSLFGTFGFVANYFHQEKIRETQMIRQFFEAGQEPIEGLVLEENYEDRLESVPENYVSGIVGKAYSNETVRLDSKYTLKV